MIYFISALTILVAFFLFYLHTIGAKKEHFGNAILEIIVVYFISNLPLVFLIWAAVSETPQDFSWPNFVQNLEIMLNAGDIFIYVSAILAPVVWTLMAYFKESHRVLSAIYIFSLLIILPFTAFAFQQSRLTEDLNDHIFGSVALIVYAIAMVMWYGATVYTRFIENYEPGSSGNSVLQKLGE